jgi:protein-disulfide isomerase
MRVHTSVRVATIALVAVAAGLTLRSALRVIRNRPLGGPASVIVQDWRLIAAVGERVGPSNPSLVITVFSDYECPGCRALHQYLSRLRRKKGARLEIVWRHYPLRAHPIAMPAARSAVCAAKLGSFERYNDLLFANSDARRRQDWLLLARRAGIRDTALFIGCIGDSATTIAVNRDIAAGRSLGIFVTPTVLVDSALFAGLTPTLQTSLESLLRRGEVRGSK